MPFDPKLLWVHGGGGGWVIICGHGHRAKKWRTVGQKVTYAGLKSDVRAKMQHWSVMILYTALEEFDLPAVFHSGISWIPINEYNCFFFHELCLCSFPATIFDSVHANTLWCCMFSCQKTQTKCFHHTIGSLNLWVHLSGRITCDECRYFWLQCL